VLEQIYEPRRLRTAWRQAKQNAGAAGIDQIFLHDFTQKQQPLELIFPPCIVKKDKNNNY
jgi:hypothetical protein